MAVLTRMPLLTPRPALVFLSSTLKQVGIGGRGVGAKRGLSSQQWVEGEEGTVV